VTPFDATGADAHGRRRIGSSDLFVPPLALGGSVFGWTLARAQSRELLDRYVEHGGGLIDTAASYASGMSEQTIGTWMRDRGSRDHVVLATKVGRHVDAPGLSERSIRDGVDASLQRLQTDTIDLLYFHAEDPETPIEESLAAVGELMQAGKVRALGASNFSLSTLLNARIAASTGLPRIDAVAWEYSLLRRDIAEGDGMELLTDHGTSLMPYFSLAHGYLGVHRGVRAETDLHETRLRRAAAHSNRHSQAVLKQLDDIALSHETDVSTVALAWVLSRPCVTAAAVGAESVEQLDGLVAAQTLTLTHHELTELDRISA
jgi:aryl-alcohol dehydrogenase-like predicted oxidoreductase